MLQKNKAPPRCTVLNEIKLQSIQYTIMLLRETLQFDSNDSKNFILTTHKSNPILQVMVKRTLPRGFLADLICITYQNYEIFSSVSEIKKDLSFFKVLFTLDLKQ